MARNLCEPGSRVKHRKTFMCTHNELGASVGCRFAAIAFPHAPAGSLKRYKSILDRSNPGPRDRANPRGNETN